MNQKLIAIYLPQYYPIEENNKWYGEGFTEWTNVSKARPLFKGHYQPHIPSDLGFYDTRLRETRAKQAELAKEYGIEGFCYWHYWFGNGKQLLEMPFREVVNDKSIDFPFCLAWANHSWEKKLWDNNVKNEVIVEQKYLGVSDYTDHFYSLLEAFKDSRYMKINGKLMFTIYDPLASVEIVNFIKVWRKLAQENDIPDFYFIGKTFNNLDRDKILSLGFDGIYNDTMLNIHKKLPLIEKVRLMISRKVFKRPTTFKYKEAAKYMYSEDNKVDNTFPVIVPNWDHSPRSGNNSIIFTDSSPTIFKKLLNKTMQQISNKPEELQIIFIKSWNEWGEGNHLEPDLKYGKRFLEVIKETKNWWEKK